MLTFKMYAIVFLFGDYYSLLEILQIVFFSSFWEISGTLSFNSILNF